MNDPNELSVRITAVTGELEAQLARAKAELAAFNAQVVEGAREAGLSNTAFVASIKAVGDEQHRLTTAVREANVALLEQKATLKEAAVGMETLAVGGVNVESMLVRVALRTTLMYAAVRPLMDAIGAIIKEHEAWTTAATATEFTLGKAAGTAKHFADAMASMSGQNASAVLTALNQLSGSSHDFATTLSETQLALDLAAASGAKLETVVHAMESATDGQVSGLKRLGIEIDAYTAGLIKAADEAQRLAIIQGLIAGRAAGSADADYLKYALPSLGGSSPQELAAEQGKLADQEERHFALLAKGAAMTDVMAESTKRQADATAKLFDQFEKLNPLLDDVGKKQAVVREQFAAAIEQIDNAEKKIAQGDPNRVAQIAELEAERVKLQAWLPTALAKAAESVSDKGTESLKTWQNALDAAEKSLEGYDAKLVDLQEAADAGGRSLDPIAAKLAQIDKAMRGDERGIGSKLAKLLAMGSDPQVEAAIQHALDLLQKYADEGEKLKAQAVGEAMAKGFDKAANSISKVTDSLRSMAQTLPDFLGAQGTAQATNIDDSLALFEKMLQDLVDSGFLSPDMAVTWLQNFSEGLTTAGKDFEKILDNAGKGFQKAVEDSTRNIGSVIEGAISGGGPGIAKALESVFAESMKKGSAVITNGLIVALGGAPDPNAYVGGATSAEYLAAKDKAGENAGKVNIAVGAGVTAAAGIYNSYTSKASEGQVALQNASVAASLAAIPAIGGYIAAAYFVVSEIAHFLSPSPSNDYKYGLPGYSAQNGGAFFVGTQNESLGEQQQVKQAITSTVESMNNAYAKIFLKLGMGGADDPRFLWGSLTQKNPSFVEMATHESFGAPGNADAFGGGGGYIGMSPSPNFNKHLQEWLTQGLPNQINDFFWKPLAAGLGSIGLSADKIAQLKAQMNAMDPTKALAYVTATVDAVTALNTEMAKLSGGPAGFGDISEASLNANPWAVAFARTSATFDDQVKETDDNILMLGQGLNLLTGQEQIGDANALAAAMKSRYEMEISYLQKVIATIASIKDSTQALLDKYTLKGINANGKENVLGEINFYNGKLAYDEKMLQQAKTPDDVKKWLDLIDQTLDILGGLGSKNGPNPKFDQWVMDQITKWEKIGEKELNDMGAKAVADGDRIYAQLKPYIDSFKNGSTAMDQATAAAKNTTDSMNDLASAAAGAADALRRIGGGTKADSATKKQETVSTPPPRNTPFANGYRNRRTTAAAA